MGRPRTPPPSRPTVSPTAGNGGAPPLVLPLPLPGRPALRRFLIRAAESVRNEGGEALLAGGFVRDLLLGREGADADLLVTGIGAPRLASLVSGWEDTLPGVRKVVPAGKHFLVHKVRIEGEEGYLDVASPAGKGGSDEAAADGGRRDFTVNALFLRLRVRGRTLAGEVLDAYGGLLDIERRRLRAVGNPEERFREDPARILRLVRLCAVLPGFVPVASTCAAARKVAQELLPSLPGERISAELIKALDASPSTACRLLARLDLLPILFPPLAGRGGEAARTIRLRLSVLSRHGCGAVSRELLCATLLYILPPGDRERLARRNALPGLRHALRLCADADSILAPSAEAPFPLASAEAFLLRRRDPKTLFLFLSSLGARERTIARNMAAAWALSLSRPRLLGGRELTRIGVAGGEPAGRILAAVREEELAGRVRGRTEALGLARMLAREAAARGKE